MVAAWSTHVSGGSSMLKQGRWEDCNGTEVSFQVFLPSDALTWAISLYTHIVPLYSISSEDLDKTSASIGFFFFFFNTLWYVCFLTIKYWILEANSSLLPKGVSHTKQVETWVAAVVLRAMEVGDWRTQPVKVGLSICSREAIFYDKYPFCVEQNYIQKDEGMKFYPMWKRIIPFGSSKYSVLLLGLAVDK